MDKQIASLSEIQSQFETTSSRLADAEALVDDLKLQLDDALHAEEMLEQLTERNLSLGERVQEMKTIIEDLEALKELNDELEETHMETERQLQEEIDLKDVQLREQRSRNDGLEADVADYEGTFGQFRELILNLQSDLETLREERAQEKEADAAGNDLSSQSQAMLSLNMKLQSSVLKSQAKAIDLELGRLQVAQAQTHLDIIRPYLPSIFFQDDADAVQALLFFQRIGHKTEIIKSSVETGHDIQNKLATAPTEALIAICQMRHSLAHFSALSRQIAAVLSRGTPEGFLKAGRMYKELTSLEKRVDMYLDALRKEELKESECASDFQRFIKQLEEFSFALGEDGGDADLAAKEVGSATLFEHDLDTLYAALGFTKQTLAALHVDASVEWELAGGTVDAAIFDPLQRLLDSIKSAKLPARKLLRRLEVLYTNDQAVEMAAIIALPSLGQTSSQLVTFATQLAQQTSAYVHDVRMSKVPFQLVNFTRQVAESTREALEVSDSHPWTSPLERTSRFSEAASKLLSAANERDSILSLGGDGPWMSRVEKIKAEAARNPEVERQVARLTDEAKELYREIKYRDERLQEEAIKVERLDRQIKASKEQADQLVSLRHELNESQKQSKAYQEANETMQGDIDNLEKTVRRMRKEAPAASEQGQSESTISRQAGFTELEGGSLETAYLVQKVQALRQAVKFLTSENAYLKSADLLQDLATLPPLYEPSVQLVEVPLKEPGMPVPAEKEGQDPVDVQSAMARIKGLRSKALHLAATPVIADVSFRKADATHKWKSGSLAPQLQQAAQRGAMLQVQADIKKLNERIKKFSSTSSHFHQQGPAMVGSYA